MKTIQSTKNVKNPFLSRIFCEKIFGWFSPLRFMAAVYTAAAAAAAVYFLAADRGMFHIKILFGL